MAYGFGQGTPQESERDLGCWPGRAEPEEGLPVIVPTDGFAQDHGTTETAGSRGSLGSYPMEDAGRRVGGLNLRRPTRTLRRETTGLKVHQDM